MWGGKRRHKGFHQETRSHTAGGGGHHEGWVGGAQRTREARVPYVILTPSSRDWAGRAKLPVGPPAQSLSVWHLALARLPLATPYLLEGSQIPDANSVVKGHSGHLSPVLFRRQRQHRGHVGAGQHRVFPGGDVQEAQVA